MIDECALDRVQLIVLSYAFDRRYLRTVGLRHRNETTVHDLAIKNHGTRATLAFTAAFLRAREMQLFTQYVEQPSHREDVDRARLSVDVESDKHVYLNEGFHQLFGHQRNPVEAHARRILERIQYGRRRAVHR